MELSCYQGLPDWATVIIGVYGLIGIVILHTVAFLLIRDWWRGR